MYEAIKKEILNELDFDENTESISDAYEKLYRLTSRLSDMDDFSKSILLNIYDKMNSGLSFTEAFKQVINSDYEFADYDYFKDVVTYFNRSLQDELVKAINSRDPENSWNASIYWLLNNATISVNNKSYTINELQSLINKG